MPPTGARRFRKPVPLSGVWTTTLDATKYGPSCLDPYAVKEKSEDCLHLNIFLPNKFDLTSPRSVMVWIHGGGYFMGTASDYDMTQFALRGDVIVVTINYRLGPLGFLSTGDATSPGNYGLWDQHMAIKWVHDNIADYGGDPNSVTVFGESAGGGSASFQTLYPGNRGLFQRAIIMSGVATSQALRANQSNIKPQSEHYLQKVGCQAGNSQTIIGCLQNISVTTLLSTFYEYFSSPCIDGDFIKGYAEDILQDASSEEFKFFSSIDYMIGALNQDGIVLAELLYPPGELAKNNITVANGFSHENICNFFAPIIADGYQANKTYVVQQICQIYKNTSSAGAQSNAALDMFTDVGFTYPSLVTADFHTRKSLTRTNTYVYMMTRYNPIKTPIFITFDWMTGATHGLDILYLFMNSLLAGQPKDYQFAYKMMDYWTNFAKNGYVM